MKITGYKEPKTGRRTGKSIRNYSR